MIQLSPHGYFFMRFYTFVFKNVVRRRVRSTLTVIGMAVAVGAVVALIGVSSGSERSFAQVYQRQNVAIIVQQRGAKQRLTSVLDEKLGDEIRKIPGVKEVNGGLVDFTSLEELGTDAVVIQGWAPGSPLMKKLEILPGGRYIEPGDSKCVLLGEELALALDKKVGDKIPLFESGEFTVVGIFRSPITYETRSMVLGLGDLQKFMGRQGQVTGFAIIVDHPDDAVEVARIRDQVVALGPRIDAKTAAESVSTTTEIRFIRATSWITSAIAIIIGAVGILNTMIMSVSERTKEIGILRAIGWRRSRIVRMILTESVLLSVAGGVVGSFSAVGLTNLLGRHPSVAGLIDTHITMPVVIFGIVSALVVGVLGAAYPAYRGAQLLPTEALRHE
jgi:putative ABC transport system permease protein